MTVHFTHLVLDAAPLINDPIPSGIADNFYTTPEVMAEIKDVATRDRLVTAYNLKVMSAPVSSLKTVTAFAKGTGDICTLSVTDLKVIALTLHLEQEHNFEQSRVRLTPPQPLIHSDQPKADEKKRDESEKTNGNAAKKTKEENDNDDVDGEGEWIGPDNLHLHQGLSSKFEQGDSSVAVACITSDYAMQNILLQMRLRLYTPDGRRVKRVKNWLLRCHACYTTTKQMDRQFCPQCGNASLLRTSYTVDQQGQVHLWLRNDFQYRLRGTQWTMPMPTGGRNGTVGRVILREDQPEYQKSLRQWQRQQQKALKTDDLDAIDDRLAAVFGGMSVSSGKKSLGATPPTVGTGRRNPNEVRRQQRK